MLNVHHQVKDNPRLGQRELKDGRISLYLEYYFGRTSTPVLDEFGEPVLYTSGAMKGKPKMKVAHDRRKETLPLYLTAKPRTPMERQQNKEILEIAKKIRFEREQQLLENAEGYRLKKAKDINFLQYFQSYLENYTKKDGRMVKMALNNFRSFLLETPEYAKFAERLRPQQITPNMVRAFTEWLQANHRGEGAKSVYQRFKKVINYAVENDAMAQNPCRGITITIDDSRLVKDILSQEEIETLLATRDERQNPEIRRAFILSLYCGIRWCDVKDLTFANVDHSNHLLKFDQAKTKGHSIASSVIIPLTDPLIRLIGEPADGNKHQLIFNLPSHTMCLKSLRRWVKRAGIEKHITWHCARHSFAVNILNNGANIKTVASLLGHSGLKHTEKYTRAVDSLKEAAINSLPELKL